MWDFGTVRTWRKVEVQKVIYCLIKKKVKPTNTNSTALITFLHFFKLLWERKNFNSLTMPSNLQSSVREFILIISIKSIDIKISTFVECDDDSVAFIFYFFGRWMNLHFWYRKRRRRTKKNFWKIWKKKPSRISIHHIIHCAIEIVIIVWGFFLLFNTSSVRWTIVARECINYEQWSVCVHGNQAISWEPVFRDVIIIINYKALGREQWERENQ